jgi:hypothetical protein
MSSGKNCPARAAYRQGDSGRRHAVFAPRHAARIEKYTNRSNTRPITTSTGGIFMHSYCCYAPCQISLVRRPAIFTRATFACRGRIAVAPAVAFGLALFERTLNFFDGIRRNFFLTHDGLAQSLNPDMPPTLCGPLVIVMIAHYSN